MVFLEGRIVIGFYESRIRIRFLGSGPKLWRLKPILRDRNQIWFSKGSDPLYSRVGSNFLEGRFLFSGGSVPVFWRVETETAYMYWLARRRQKPILRDRTRIIFFCGSDTFFWRVGFVFLEGRIRFFGGSVPCFLRVGSKAAYMYWLAWLVLAGCRLKQ